jgi:hypothetical protein
MGLCHEGMDAGGVRSMEGVLRVCAYVYAVRVLHTAAPPRHHTHTHPVHASRHPPPPLPALAPPPQTCPRVSAMDVFTAAAVMSCVSSYMLTSDASSQE